MDTVLDLVDDIKCQIKDQQYIDLMNALSKVQSSRQNLLNFGVMELSDLHDFGLTMIWRDNDMKYHKDDGPAVVKIFHCGAIRSGTWMRHGQIHRDGDWPARMFFYQNGNIDRLEWYRDDQQHREIGPAVITYDIEGNIICMEWRRCNDLHRLDGPASVVFNNGMVESESWYLRGLLHRDDGAAQIYYRNGEIIQQRYYHFGVTR